MGTFLRIAVDFAFWLLVLKGIGEFLVWVERYQRISRFRAENPGLFYLIILREQFGSDR